MFGIEGPQRRPLAYANKLASGCQARSLGAGSLWETESLSRAKWFACDFRSPEIRSQLSASTAAAAALTNSHLSSRCAGGSASGSSEVAASASTSAAPLCSHLIYGSISTSIHPSIQRRRRRQSVCCLGGNCINVSTLLTLLAQVSPPTCRSPLSHLSFSQRSQLPSLLQRGAAPERRRRGANTYRRGRSCSRPP